MAKSAKAKAAAQLLDKRSRQQLTERTEKAPEEARFGGSFRCNTCVSRCVLSNPHVSDPSQTLKTTNLLSSTVVSSNEL